MKKSRPSEVNTYWAAVKTSSTMIIKHSNTFLHSMRMRSLPTATMAVEVSEAILVASSLLAAQVGRCTATLTTLRVFLVLCKRNNHINKMGSDRSEATATKWERAAVEMPQGRD